MYAQWKTTYVKPEIKNLVAFRTANASGGASPTVTSTGKTGFCKFLLVGGANYTFTSATVQFGAATAKSMTKSGSTLYGYSTVGSIAQASAYTVKVTVVVTGADGIARTYTDSTYISKSVPAFDVSNNGNCFAFFGTATDGLTSPKLIINGELAFDTETSAAGARANLGLTGIETRTLLWTNASPKSEFAAQTILNNPTGQLSEYDAVEVEFLAKSDDVQIQTIRVKKGACGNTVMQIKWDSGTNAYIGLRSVSCDSNVVAFGVGGYLSGISTLYQLNLYCIPQRVYGIKEM